MQSANSANLCSSGRIISRYLGSLKAWGSPPAVEPQFRHAVVGSRNSERNRVFDDVALHVLPDMTHEFGNALDERPVLVLLSEAAAL